MITRIFGSVAAVWAVLALGMTVLFTPGPELSTALGWLVSGLLVTNLDLLALARAVEAVMALVGGAQGEKRRQAVLSLSFWGPLKMAGFLFLIAFLFKGKNAPFMALMGGLANFIVVPLLGGALWSAWGYARVTEDAQ